VKESFSFLARHHDVIVIEGAGCPAEINLREFDFVNMRMADWAQAPVILVGDIERGGVFASLYGTWSLLSPQERGRICGFVINKFRGERSLLGSGIKFLEEKTGIPTLGVLPYADDLWLEEEDTLGLGQDSRPRKVRSFDIAVFQFPRISNFTDFRPLELEEGVNVRYFRKAGELGNPDLVILPGTKNTAADARFLNRNGIDRVLKNYVRSGGRLMGICGGLQLLGEEIEDDSAEISNGDTLRGLGFFPLKTNFLKRKLTYQVQARPAVPELSLDSPVEGYEIHMGKTVARRPVEPFMLIERRGGAPVQLPDGVVDRERRVFGTYIHGLFANDRFRETFLRFLKPGFRPATKSRVNFKRDREQQYKKLARRVEANLDLKSIFRWLR